MKHALPLLTLFIAGCAVPLAENDLTLSDFDLTWTGEPGNLDITSGDGAITCDMTVTTTGLSAMDAICRFVSPTGVVRDCFTSGPPVGDVWTCSVTIPQYSESGTWTVDYVSLRDTGGTPGKVTGAQLDTDGKETEVVVTSPSPDTVAPTIEAFTASPEDLQTAGGQLFVCAVTASDVGSGIKDRGCTFKSPDGTQALTCIDEAATCDTLSQAGGEEGTWPLYSIFARDNLLNTEILYQDDVLAIGGTTSISVGLPPSPQIWPNGPADTCTLNTPDIATQGGCICEGVEYQSGYCCTEGFSWSSCSSTYLYATPTGSGTASGADWNNALAGLPTGNAWVRDRVYWISEGTFATDLLTFSEPESGALGITIKKATDCGGAQDCTATGWSSTMGDEQSVFEQINITTDYWTIDGTTQQGYGSGTQAGILITTTDLLDAGGNESLIGVNADYLTIRNADINVGFVGTTSSMTAGACSGIRVPAASTVNNLVLDRVEIHNVADDGISFDAVDTVIVAQTLIHEVHGCGTDSSCSSCSNGHGDGIEIFSSDNITISESMIYNIVDTSAIIVDDGSSGSNPSLNLVVRNTIGYVDKVPGGQLPITIKYVDGATFTGNVFWGVQSGDRFGGCYFNGNGVDNLVFKNNICTNINFNFNNNPGAGNSEFDPAKHDLSNNQFGGLITTEYPDGESTGSYQVGDPLFVAIPYSSDLEDHYSEGAAVSDFFLQAVSPALDFGATVGPAWSINGTVRPQGPAYDPGVYEAAGIGGFGGAAGAGGAGGAAGAGGAGGAACSSTPTDITASNDQWTWVDAADPATGDLDFTIFAKTSGLDSLVWVTDGAISAFTDAAMIARFNPSGKVDARDGAFYVSENAFPPTGSYDLDTWHEFKLTVSVGAQTYDVDVRLCGDPAFTRIATQADFRTTITSATHYGLWSSTGVTLDAGDAVWTPGACTPRTCAYYDPNSCGAAPDGCGDFLSSCGTCGGGETCHPTDWNCCTLDTCVGLGADCGFPPDGCGGTLDCDTPGCTVGGETCQGDFTCSSSSKPSPSNTGPTNPGAIVPWPYGSHTITNSGVYENFSSASTLTIDANNVTLRNCTIENGDAGYAIFVESSSSNLLVEDCEISRAKECILDYGNGTTLRRVYCHDTQADGMKFSGYNTLIEYSLIEKHGMNGTSGHHDGIQLNAMDHASTYTIRYNTIRGNPECQYPPWHSSDAIILEKMTGSNAYIHNNWFNGGTSAYMIDGSSAGGGHMYDNQFGAYYQNNLYTSVSNEGGNVWECDQTPVTSGTQAKPSCAPSYPGPPCQ